MNKEWAGCFTLRKVECWFKNYILAYIFCGSQFAGKINFLRGLKIYVPFIKDINQQVLPDVDIFNETLLSRLSYTNKSEAITTIYNAAISKMLSKTFTDEERKKLGHSLEDILYRCSFNNEPCGVEDFAWKFDRYYGNCYVFNSGFNATGGKVELKKSLFSGSTYGLQMDFYVGFHQNLTLFNSIAGKGGFVKVENSSYLNDDTLDGILLTPGLSLSISIARKLGLYLPSPYSNCDIDNVAPGKFTSDLFRLIFHSAYAYSQQLCFTQCFQARLIRECNCSDPQSLSLFNAVTCETSDQQDCMSEKYVNILLKDNFVGHNCVPVCPLECNRTAYDMFASSTELLGDLYAEFIRASYFLTADFIGKPVTADTSKQNFVSFYLYYDSLSYTLSTEAPSLDVVALLANIGGTLGLFLGVSLLHVCEIVDVLIEIGFVKAEKQIKPSSIQ